MVDPRAEEADDDGGVGVGDGAAGGDGDERAEERVARVAKVPDVGAAQHVWQAALDHEAGGGARGCGEGGGDGGAGHVARVVAAVGVDGEGRARVEAVPSEPEEEGAEDLRGEGGRGG